MAGLADHDTLLRYLHVLSGIVWIGMLYFFNLVNLPLLKFSLRRPYEFNMGEKAAAHVIGKTLFWFRWGAASTVLFGLVLLYLHTDAYRAMWEAGGEARYPLYAILVGALFGLVMAFNVWAIIWPRQKKILANNKAIAASTDEAEKKRLGDENAPLVKVATMASRTNTWLSVPMLWGMVFGTHGAMGAAAWGTALAGLLLVLALMVLYAKQKPKA